MTTRIDLLPYRPRIEYNTHSDIKNLMDFPIYYDNVFAEPKENGFVGVICQNDTDGITSGESYSEYHGLPLVGVFDYTRLMMFEGYEHIDPKKCIWIDCDIVDPNYHSIGNHTTMFTNRDTVSENNFNLSNYYALHGQRGSVYPYHFTGSTLLMLYAMGMTNVTTEEGRRLVLFADGTWKNKAAFNDTKIDIWLDKMNVLDELSPLMPESNDDPRFNEFVRLSKRIGYRRGWRNDKPFRFNEDGTIHCEYDLAEMMKLLGINRQSQIVGRRAVEVMTFETGKISTEYRQYHDKKHFQRVHGIPNLFALTFLNTNTVLYCYQK